MKYFLHIIVAILGFIGESSSQSYYFRHYEVENGLSNNTVFHCIQDKDGFMWFGTKDGLNRFDGYRFKIFNIYNPDRNNLSRDLISAFANDNKGNLWVGSEKGLYQFDAKRERLVPFVDSLRDINDIFADKKGRLWFISAFKLCRYDLEKNTVTSYPVQNNFYATSICETDDGTMWFSCRDGFIYRYNETNDKFTSFNLFAHSPIASSNWISEIVVDNHGNIFAGTTSQGIKRFNIEKATYEDILTYNSDRTVIYVRDILQATDKEIWFATESGIFILNTETGKFENLRKKFLDPYSLSDNAVYTLYKDREGGIWAGTYFGGLNYYPKQYATFQKFFPDYSKHSISGSAVREICEDNFGNLWVGTEDAGLTKINQQTNEITHFGPTGAASSISNSNIHGLLSVGNDLWIGTFERGLDIMDIRTGKVKKHYGSGPGPHDLKSDFIVTMLQTKKGDIYIGSNSGIYYYNKKDDNFDRVKMVPPGGFISSLLEDNAGRIWMGTHGNGVFYFNPETGEAGHYLNEANNKNSISANIVNAIHQDSNNDLWFATEGGGLCKLVVATKTFTRFTTNNGLPSNFIFKVLEDRQNILWVTTSKGLASMENGRITVYTKANGLLNDQFNYNSGYRDAKGTLYFGSVRGMITFDPSDFHQSKFAPPVFITGFQVSNKELEIDSSHSPLKQTILYTDKLVLPHDQSTFSIDFAALSFASPERTEFAYKMDGIDQDWTNIKSNRKVYYTNIKPGTYNFKLKATSASFEGSYEKSLSIKILPPIWATYYAYALYIAVGLLLLYYIVRSYHNIQESKKEKEIYEAKIDFFTNIAHEIKTPLTLIKGPVENLSEMVNEVPVIKQDVGMMERNTKRLVNLVNQILDFRQVEAKGFSLDFSSVNIGELIRENYLSFEALAQKKKFEYILDLPTQPVFTLADDEALTKILTNLFSNAVKYADRKVLIRLIPPAKAGEEIKIEVWNDGNIIPVEMKKKIFEPFVRLKETIKQKGTGIGLALAKSLSDLHGGSLYYHGEENGMNLFVFTLPYKPSNKQKETNELIAQQVNT